MKTCKKCLTEKDESEFYAHNSTRDRLQISCKACMALAAKNNPNRLKNRAAWKKANPEKVRASARKTHAKDPSKLNKIRAAWWRAHPEKLKAKIKRYQQKHRAEISARQALRQRENPEAVNALNALRRARERQATVSWANLTKIRAIYALRVKKQRDSGEPWHVDHIIPLKHKLVCGLHNEFNLRAMPGADNLRKSNQFTPFSERLS